MSESGLRRGITGPGFFALAFGTIVGSAWMVLMGEWVSPAGPGGAVMAFMGMALLMVPMAGAYTELMARVPRAGSESVFGQALSPAGSSRSISWASAFSKACRWHGF